VGRRSDNAALIAVVDALVDAHPAAYTTDRFGTVANPAVPCFLRDLTHQLAELIFDRDGCYPEWWRGVGEAP
jgi:hypothetical protein